MPTRLGIFELRLNRGGGGASPPKVSWVSDASTIPENGIRGIQVELDKAASKPVVAVFEVGGAAVHGTHYRFRGGATTSDPIKNRPTIGIGAGETKGVLYIEGLTVSANIDATLTLVDSVEWSDGVTYTSSGVDLADDDLTHTATIVDSGSGLVVDFSLKSSVVTETDSDFVHEVELTLNRPNDTGGNVTVEVTDNGSGDAVAGTDYSLTADPLTVTFANGDQTARVPVTIKSTPTDADDETLVLALQTPGTGLSLGSTQQTHTLLIRDDEPDTGTGTVGFIDGSDENVTEGSQIHVPVVWSGNEEHAQLSTQFTVRGAANGPSGRAAKAGEYHVQTPAPLVIPDGTKQADFVVSAVQDQGQAQGPRDIRVALGPWTLPLGASKSPHQSKFITIQDDDSGGDGGDIDGELTRIDGTRIAPERRGLDPTAPDFICRQIQAYNFNGLSAAESVEVVSDRASAATELAKGVYAAKVAWPGTNSAIKAAWQLGEKLWMYLHGPSGTVSTNTDTGSVAIGTELDEVLIECEVADIWRPEYLSDQLPWDPDDPDDPFNTGDPAFNPTEKADELKIWDGSAGIEWDSDAGNTVIRDVIMYSSFTDPPKCASVFGLQLGSFGRIDNVRFERIHFVGSKGSAGGSMMSGRGGNQHKDLDPTPHPVHGRLKIYDGQISSHPATFVKESDPNKPSLNGYQMLSGNKHLFLMNALAWDLRMRANGMPWRFWWSGFEHNWYCQAPTGDGTYPQLKVDPADGSYTRASSVFVNLRHPMRHSPMHPGAVQDGQGNWVGPRMTNYRTYFQWTNRNEHSWTSDMSSGLVAWVRCFADGYFGLKDIKQMVGFTSAGHAFKVHGHNGEVLFRDCGITGHFETGDCGGGIKIELEGTGSTSTGPYQVYWLEPEAGRYYGGVKLSMEGFTASGGNHDKSVMALSCPPETVDWKKFDLRTYNIGKAGGQIAIGSAFEHPGPMALKVWDVSDLRDPDDETSAYTGAFSGYPGWSSQGPKMRDGYHQNWWTGATAGSSNNSITLNDDDVDNFPTDGPAGYGQTNGIVDQQYANRLIANWAASPGTAEVKGSAGSPTWTSAYDPRPQPEEPKCELDPGTDLYIGEGEDDRNFEVRFRGAAWTQIRTAFTFTDSSGATTDLQVADRNEWDSSKALPNPATYSSAVSPVVMKPLGGQLGAGDKDDTVDFTYFHGEPSDVLYQGQIAPTFDRLFFRVITATGISTGTKTTTFALDSANCDFETYPKSGAYQACDTSGPQSRDIKVVPAVDFGEANWSQTTVPVGSSAGAFVPVWRLNSANDGLELESVLTIQIDKFPSASITSFTLYTNQQSVTATSGTETVQLTIPGGTGAKSAEFGVGIKDIVGDPGGTEEIWLTIASSANATVGFPATCVFELEDF